MTKAALIAKINAAQERTRLKYLCLDTCSLALRHNRATPDTVMRWLHEEELMEDVNEGTPR
jgi:hypothetical protein